MYVERFQLISKTTGRYLQEFTSHAGAVKAMGGEDKLREFCERHNCYTAFVQRRGGHSCMDESATMVNGRWVCNCPK